MRAAVYVGWALAVKVGEVLEGTCESGYALGQVADVSKIQEETTKEVANEAGTAEVEIAKQELAKETRTAEVAAFSQTEEEITKQLANEARTAEVHLMNQSVSQDPPSNYDCSGHNWVRCDGKGNHHGGPFDFMYGCWMGTGYWNYILCRPPSDQPVRTTVEEVGNRNAHARSRAQHGLAGEKPTMLTKHSGLKQQKLFWRNCGSDWCSNGCKADCK
jgi:hypothetical protein